LFFVASKIDVTLLVQQIANFDGQKIDNKEILLAYFKFKNKSTVTVLLWDYLA